MPRENPLELLEITSLIASYLKEKDLASCVQVSKSWQGLFLPHRWRAITCGSRGDCSQRDSFGPDHVVMYHHRYLIKDLSVVTDFQRLENPFPNLHTLSISRDDGTWYSSEQLSLDLITMAPMLVSVEFVCVELASTTWQAVSAHPHIKNLKLTGIMVDEIDAPIFWKACAKMEVLELEDGTIESMNIPEDVVFHRLRKLELTEIQDMDVETQMDLILRCPKLEDVLWDIGGLGDDKSSSSICHPIQNEHWPYLNKLNIACSLQDTDVASILKGTGNGFGNIVELWLYYCSLGVRASKALGLHFGTLVKLDIASCYSVASSTIRDVLCFCPKLEELIAGSVLGQDIAKGGPWVCQQLQKLTICFRVGKSERDLQQLVFERLSTLVRLEELKMQVPRWSGGESYEDLLDFHLDCGLGQLASLQQLTTLRFYDFTGWGPYYAQINLEEIEWMVGNWKQLKRIIGRLNMDFRLSEQLVRVMMSHGITHIY